MEPVVANVRHHESRMNKPRIFLGSTAGVYVRADLSDLQVLDGGSEEERAPAHRGAPPGVEVGRERILRIDRVA
jgi:hypothetical protein